MATYGSVAGVEALVSEVGTLSGSTTPTTTEVGAWLAAAYGIINRKIGSAGYVVPVTDTTVELYPELTMLANLYAAVYVLRARGIDTASGQTVSRDVVWLKDFYAQLNDLIAGDLTLMGLTATENGVAAWSVGSFNFDWVEPESAL